MDHGWTGVLIQEMNKHGFSGEESSIPEGCTPLQLWDGSSWELCDHLMLTEVNTLELKELEQLLWGEGMGEEVGGYTL